LQPTDCPACVNPPSRPGAFEGEIVYECLEPNSGGGGGPL
jgi:hypothetical protein